MQLKLIKATWDMEGGLEEKIPNIAEAGYRGIDMPPPDRNPSDLRKLPGAASLISF